jgi:uncharacterized protein (TIGR03437 family)
LQQPEGIAFDGLGSVYVADAGENRVRKIAPDGTIKTLAGSGQAGFSGDGGPAISARLNHPYGIALDLTGNLYIADLGNARVRMIDTAGNISTVAGGGTSAISGSPGPAATAAQLSAPRNVAIDIPGNLYISDFNAQQIYRVTPAGVISVFAGTGTAGYAGDGGDATMAQIAYPAGLTTDAFGNLYIADSGNNCVRRVWYGAISTIAVNVPSPTGVAVDALGHIYAASSSTTSGTAAVSPAGLNVVMVTAEDVASDPGGTLYLAVQQSVEKQVGSTATVLAGCSNCPGYGDGGPATAALLDGPVALAIDAGGDIYIAEQSGNRIRTVAAKGAIATLAGAVSAPSGVAVDSSGSVDFSELNKNRVRRISAGGVLSTVVDSLDLPACVRVGPDGSLYVCDGGNGRILKVSMAGVVSTYATVAQPSGLAVASDGAIFVSSGSQVVQISVAGLSTVVADGLSNPAGLALLSTGELVIAESGKNRVLELGAAGAVTVLASGLNNPEDVAIDAAGDVLIADTGNNRVAELVPVAVAVVPAVTVVNAASLAAGPIAPNEIVTIYGSGFDPANTQVTFDGTAATVFYSGATQLNVLVPAMLGANALTAISVVSDGAQVGSGSVSTVAAAPGIFTVAGGTGQAAALNQDGTVNSASNPVARGSIVVLYLTGDGGSVISVTIGSYSADVLYAGPAPGYPGLTQVNAVVPAEGLAGGSQPVVVRAGGVGSQSGVIIFVH